MLKIAPSILAADFGHLSEEIRKVEKAGADMIHIDVMDGHFVPNLSMGPMIVNSIRKNCSLPFDVHLMVEKPEKFISAFIEAGADILTVHADNNSRLYGTVQLIKSYNKKVGVAFCPVTPIDVLGNMINDLSLILTMSVEPGFSGQSFMECVLPKIRETRKIIDSKKLLIDLAVDGGINEKTASKVVEAGANLLIMGSAVFEKKKSKELKDLFQYIRSLE